MAITESGESDESESKDKAGLINCYDFLHCLPSNDAGIDLFITLFITLYLNLSITEKLIAHEIKAKRSGSSA